MLNGPAVEWGRCVWSRRSARKTLRWSVTQCHNFPQAVNLTDDFLKSLWWMTNFNLVCFAGLGLIKMLRDVWKSASTGPTAARCQPTKWQLRAANVEFHWNSNCQYGLIPAILRIKANIRLSTKQIQNA